MSVRRSNGEDEAELRRSAAEWCVLMASGTAGTAEKARFAEWVTSSPRHLAEYAAHESLWHESARFGPWLGLDSRVVSLYPMQHGASVARPGRGRRPRLAALAASLAVLAVMTSWLLLASLPHGGEAPQRYATAVGENRLLTLEDGSLVELNTASTARVEYDENRRRIRLESGEGFFTVRKDPDRPFLVVWGKTEVRALGTAFNVKAVDDILAVTVLEGSVLVSESDDPDAGDGEGAANWQRSLSADRQLVVRREIAGPAIVEHEVEADLVTSWRQNKLAFSDVRLRDVVADFNRYNRRRILLSGKGLEEIRISGTFDPRDPEGFARTVAKIADADLSDIIADRIVLSSGSRELP